MAKQILASAKRCAEAPVDRFPKGLEQAEGFCRFGADTLLLAALAARFAEKRSASVIELGCGCGAALFGFLLLCPRFHGLGLDFALAQVEAAKRNARNLALEERCGFLQADVTTFKKDKSLYGLAGTYDLVLANPPWRLPGDGRAAGDKREVGRRSPAGDILADFFKLAAYLLRRRGHFYLILPAGALARIFLHAQNCGLGVRFLLPLRMAPQKDICGRVFAGLQKGAKTDPALLSPLALWPSENDAARQPWTSRVFQLRPCIS